ncbi:hypothetical protein B0H13DRAFT_2309641 [Mycena leptocephala]|nr:hypothetical protein B0H13DRAFT_2309641 [Mycena leptocephala]
MARLDAPSASARLAASSSRTGIGARFHPPHLLRRMDPPQLYIHETRRTIHFDERHPYLSTRHTWTPPSPADTTAPAYPPAAPAPRSPTMHECVVASAFISAPPMPHAWTHSTTGVVRLLHTAVALQMLASAASSSSGSPTPFALFVSAWMIFANGVGTPETIPETFRFGNGVGFIETAPETFGFGNGFWRAETKGFGSPETVADTFVFGNGFVVLETISISNGFGAPEPVPET